MCQASYYPKIEYAAEGFRQEAGDCRTGGPGVESSHGRALGRNAVEQAKAAAGGKDVVVIGGASTVRQCLNAGLADEFHMDVMPVLLGGGLRLFEDTGAEPLQLERLAVTALPGGRTHLRFRVVK